MKKIITIVLLIIMSVLFFTACDDMLNTDSERLLFTEQHKLDSANDSLYSVVGILHQLQKLGDRYVILGDLRADLMDITKNSDLDLQDINNHTIAADNPYVGIKEYYAVINNCNYFIQHVDTSIFAGGKKTMYGEFALVKAIRAWTYMQIALNYGKVTYMEQPILTLDDMNREYMEYDLYELSDKLIDDLLPFEHTEYPLYGSAGKLNMKYLMLPISFILGDLYLWKGQYEMAAAKYYNLIYKESYTISSTFISYWLNQNFTPYLYRTNWNLMFSETSDEIMSRITYTYDSGNASKMPNLMLPPIPGLNFEYKLAPSQIVKNMWKNQVYTYYNSNNKQTTNTFGDFRGLYGSYNVFVNSMDSTAYISKYAQIVNNSINVNQTIFLYRTTTLYLRYAEAVNRMGKPSLAFAVMKYGLNSKTLKEQVSANEITPLPAYCNFTDKVFDMNIGIRARTLGDTDRDTLFYVFPETLTTLSDSIEFVDDLLCQEFALETAFEGNRFHDLMRFAIRRNDPAYLADKVGAKHKNSAVRNKLLDMKNWYLPSN